MKQPISGTYYGNIITDPKVANDPSSLQVGDMLLDQNCSCVKVKMTPSGSFISLPLTPEYTADSGQSGIDEINDKVQDIMAKIGIPENKMMIAEEEDLYRLIAQEMIVINPLFFNEDFLYNALHKTMKSTYGELAYGVLSDEFMPIVEADKVDEFKELLKEAIAIVENRINEKDGWTDKIDDILEIMSRVCNKFRYDKLVMKLALNEMKAQI